MVDEALARHTSMLTGDDYLAHAPKEESIFARMESKNESSEGDIWSSVGPLW